MSAGGPVWPQILDTNVLPLYWASALLAYFPRLRWIMYYHIKCLWGCNQHFSQWKLLPQIRQKIRLLRFKTNQLPRSKMKFSFEITQNSTTLCRLFWVVYERLNESVSNMILFLWTIELTPSPNFPYYPFQELFLEKFTATKEPPAATTHLYIHFRRKQVPRDRISGMLQWCCWLTQLLPEGSKRITSSVVIVTCLILQ